MNNRRITLYIDGQRADMTADSLVLMNYTASDLSNPAAVKNSYSQQATLPATAANDKIFSSIYRADWRRGASSFNPLIRTPFAIYEDTGAMLESGYLKLNTTSYKNGVRNYVVTLYGGLGSFFYLLSYDDEGNTLSLGDLPLLGDDPTQKIDFKINAPTVAAAWDRLKNKTLANAAQRQFDVVNFAPAYNGLPEGEFDASKGVGNPQQVGGESTITDGGNIYTAYGDNSDALYDFGDDFTEWETKDLRSYMQRPVASIKGLLSGIIRYAAAREFTVNLDPAWFSMQNPYYEKTWMTLPLLAGRSVPNAEEGTFDMSGQELIFQDKRRSMFIPLTPTISANNAVVTVKCRPQPIIWPYFDDYNKAPATIAFNSKSIAGGAVRYAGMGLFLQVQLLGENDEIVAASPIHVCTTNTYPGLTTGTEWVAKANLQECKVDKGGVEEKPYSGLLSRLSGFSEPGYTGAWYGFDQLPEIEVSAYGALSARICIEARPVVAPVGGGEYKLTTDNPNYDELYCTDGAGTNTPFRLVLRWGGRILDGTFEYSAGAEYRSGAQVTQEALFADTMSPLEFLLSYSKTFGLHYLYDHTRKQVDIVTRNTLYGNRKTVDLQQRIDRSRDITTSPIPMDAKWLEFAPQDIEGEFVSYYKSKYGRQYGTQKVNTGYEFDANTTQVLDNAKFNGGAEVLQRSTYYLYVVNTRVPRIPTPILAGKTTYKLFRDENGELQSHETPYPNLTLAANGFTKFRYFNANKGYDAVPKLQCHGNDNTATDGAGILLFHRGLASADGSIKGDAEAADAYTGFRITDDSAAMYALNDRPCWELSAGTEATDMPAFGRFWLSGSLIRYSMEFGTPAEIDNPVIGIQANTSLYERFWASYIADRNDVNTRICSAYVDLRGFQPGPEMLRDFYYFDNALWVLNKIANYSLSTPGTTQCEFVKVQAQANYAAGQLLDATTDDLTLSLTTDGTDLYVRTSRPLADGERVKILTRGSGRCCNKLGVPNLNKHHRSRKRWHVPFEDHAYAPKFPIDANGKIGGLGEIGKWRLEIDHRNSQMYCHIYKANWSHGFGYKAAEGLNKAVTFAVCIYDGKNPVSNRCYFESRCHIRKGVLTQEFVTPE